MAPSIGLTLKQSFDFKKHLLLYNTKPLHLGLLEHLSILK